eukprot:12021850-Prorocentrum_lima.AAC.1
MGLTHLLRDWPAGPPPCMWHRWSPPPHHQHPRSWYRGLRRFTRTRPPSRTTRRPRAPLPPTM